MNDIINIGTFIEQLTYYVRITIFINKGTDNNTLLEKCIKIHNKYKEIENNINSKVDDENEIFIRKSLKRLNLILKVDDYGNPVNIRDKNNQRRMIYLHGHPSLEDDNLCEMIEYASKYNINILVDVPLMFILRDSKYQNLLWQYTRSLFYISQILISNVDATADPTNTNVIAKKLLFEKCFSKLELILENISSIEDKINLNSVLEMDKFLTSKLVKTGLDEKNVNNAKNEIKNMFLNKGVDENSVVVKMIDSISNKLSSFDISKGNVTQNIMGIAGSVAQEIRQDLETNPEQIQITFDCILNVFQDIDSTDQNNQVPSEIKNMINCLKTMTTTDGNPEEITKNLEEIVANTGIIDKDELNSIINNENDTFDLTKMNCLLNQFGNSVASSR